LNPASRIIPRGLIAAALVIVVLAVFGPAARYGFVGWDDDILVYNNPHLKPPRPGNLLRFWRGPHEGLYIPVTYSFWGLLAFSSRGFDPRIFHGANIAIHVLNVLLLFSILERVFRDGTPKPAPSASARGGFRPKRDSGAGAGSETGRILAASLGAALYAVHPLQVESVVWVSSLKDLLCGFFSLLALRFYLSYARRSRAGGRGGMKFAAAATGAFALALLSKPAAVSLPPIAWLLLHFRPADPASGRGRDGRPALFRPPQSLLLGWILISVPVVLAAKFAERDIPLGFVAALPGRLLIAGDGLGFYLFKLFVPLNLGIDYGRIPRLVLDDPGSRFFWLIPLLVAALCLLGRHRRQWLIALGVFAAGAAPTLGLVPHGFQVFSTVADRFLYLALLGPALALGWAAIVRRRSASIWLGVILVALLGLGNVRQRRYWADNLTLFRHALEVNERSYMAHYNLGLTLDGRGKPAAAVFHYRRALEIKPDYGRAHNNLGAALVRQGRLAEAIGSFAEAFRLEPGNRGAYFNLYTAHNLRGVELAEAGNPEEAVFHFSEALRLKPDYDEARRNLSRARRAGEESGPRPGKESAGGNRDRPE